MKLRHRPLQLLSIRGKQRLGRDLHGRMGRQELIDLRGARAEVKRRLCRQLPIIAEYAPSIAEGVRFDPLTCHMGNDWIGLPARAEMMEAAERWDDRIEA